MTSAYRTPTKLICNSCSLPFTRNLHDVGWKPFGSTIECPHCAGRVDLSSAANTAAISDAMNRMTLADWGRHPFIDRLLKRVRTERLDFISAIRAINRGDIRSYAGSTDTTAESRARLHDSVRQLREHERQLRSRL